MIKNKLKKIIIGTLLLTFITPAITSYGVELSSNTTFTPTFTSISDVSSFDDKTEELELFINNFLSLKYKIMQTNTFISSDTFVDSPALLEVLDKRSELYDRWCKANNLTCEAYRSKTEITNTKQLTNNSYIIDVAYSVTSKMKDSDVESISNDEKYRFEIAFDNGSFKIKKMQDINMTSDEKALEYLNQRNTFNYMNANNSDVADFKNYEDDLNDQLENLNNVDENFYSINKAYNEMLHNNDTVDNVKTVSSCNTLVAPATYSASNYKGYDRGAAVAYAHLWALTPNYKSYKYIDGADSTNYVSQCVNAGGVPRQGLWQPYTKPWVCVIDFYNWMIKNGYAVDDGLGCKNARLGDVIQFFHRDAQQWTHSVILTKQDDKGMYYCGHSNERYDAPVWQPFMDGKYGNIRVVNLW